MRASEQAPTRPLCQFRRQFDQYVNIRPVRFIPGIPYVGCALGDEGLGGLLTACTDVLCATQAMSVSARGAVSSRVVLTGMLWIDMWIVRVSSPLGRFVSSRSDPGPVPRQENTEGEYSSIGGRMFQGTERETVSIEGGRW